MPISRLDKLLEMLQIQPEDPFLLYAVGFEYEAIGADNKAMEYYSIILENQPDYLAVYYQAGLLYAKLGEFERATELLTIGIELAKAQKDIKTLRELNEALQDLMSE